MKIEELVALIKSDKLVLPEIQRNFVWNLQKIADLWDSIYRGYPIGQLLFWETTKKIPAYSFFNHDLSDNNIASKLLFIAKKPEPKSWAHDKPSASTNKIIVLDGQQRLTALYLGLSQHGIKVQPQRNSRDRKIHIMKLGLLINQQAINKTDESPEEKPLFAWKPVDENGKIKDPDYISLPDALSDKKRSDQIKTLKSRLRYKTAITIPVMDLTGMGTSDVLEIFQRLNNGGQKMSKSELFLAMYFGEDNANNLKKDINDLRNLFGDFAVKDDTVTRILAVIFGEKSDNLTKNEYSPDMFPRIQKGFGKLKTATQQSIKFLNDDCGIFSDSEMLSHSLFAPIIHTFFINPTPTIQSKKYLRSFVFRALIFGLFDRSTSTTLARLKEFVNDVSGDWTQLNHLQIMKNETRNIEEIFGDHFGDRQWLPTKINTILTDWSKGAKTNLVLLLLKSEKANTKAGKDYYDQDHLIASNLFDQPAQSINSGLHKYGKTPDGSKRLSPKEAKIWDRRRKKWSKMRDCLPNLWLLNDSMNRSKGKQLLDLWYLSPTRTEQQKQEKTNFWTEAMLDQQDPSYLKITNFETIFADRKKRLAAALTQLLAL